MIWNIREFYQLVQQQLSPQDISSLQLPLRSIPWKFVLCRYHIEEANRILSEGFTWPEEKQLAEAVGKVLMQSAGTDEGRKFAEACLYAEAHIIAFAQSMHSTADMLAQVLCISLKLDGLFTAKENRYLHIVVNRLDKHGIAPTVVMAATCFLESDEFRYLRAYVNTTKHTSLVGSGYLIRLVPGQEKHGLKITAFKYHSENWPQKWVTDFIGADFERLSSMFGAIGIELTAVIHSQQSPTTSA